jgi:hypothetical protein
MSIRARLRRLLLPTLVGLALAAALPAAAQIQARLSASAVNSGQPVTLTLSSPAPLPATPELTPLDEAFRILSQRRATVSSTVDGRRVERHELILTLLPRRTGDLLVPALRIGDASTEPMPLSVAAASNPQAQLLQAPSRPPTSPADAPPQPITLSAEVSPARGVAGQQFVLTVRATSPEGPPTGHLPIPRAAGVRVLPLGTLRTEDAGGVHAFEQRFALFPTESGRIRLDDIGFDAWQPAGGAPVRHRADPVQIRVTAPPPGTDPAAWLPARDLSLTEAGPAEVRIAPGQGIERMITLRADGLMAEDLPAIPLEIPFPLRVRDDPPRLWNERTPDGVVGYRAERVLVSAPDAGSFVLPGPAIDWWDTATGTRQTARLPDWTLTVAPFASADRRPAARWERDRPDTGATPPEAASAGTPPADPAAAAAGGFHWSWLAAATAGLVLLGLLLRLGLGRIARRRTAAAAASPTAPAAPPPSPQPDPAALVDAVRRAYAAQDASAARDALLAWAAHAWPQSPPRNLSQLMLRLEPPLRDDVKLLDGAFYGPRDGAWAARPVADRLAALTPDQDTAATDADAATPA